MDVFNSALKNPLPPQRKKERSEPPARSESPPEEDRRKKNSRRKHRNSHLGCGTCKKRRIKCDENLPQCFNCVKGKLHCAYLNLDAPARNALRMAQFNQNLRHDRHEEPMLLPMDMPDPARDRPMPPPEMMRDPRAEFYPGGFVPYARAPVKGPQMGPSPYPMVQLQPMPVAPVQYPPVSVRMMAPPQGVYMPSEQMVLVHDDRYDYMQRVPSVQVGQVPQVPQVPQVTQPISQVPQVSPPQLTMQGPVPGPGVSGLQGLVPQADQIPHAVPPVLQVQVPLSIPQVSSVPPANVPMIATPGANQHSMQSAGASRGSADLGELGEGEVLPPIATLARPRLPEKESPPLTNKAPSILKLIT